MKLSTIWTVRAMSTPERLRRTRDWAYLAAAGRLPRRFAYWVLIAQGGKYMENDVVPEVTFMTILQRADKAL